MAKKKKRKKNRWLVILIATYLAIMLLMLFSKDIQQLIPSKYYNSTIVKIKAPFYVKRLYENYNNKVDILAKQFNLPAEYLKALIILESSGNNNIPNRFEKHVFTELKKVREGTRKNYENIIQKTIYDASDEALKNLASSWGPFQLMGYKCVLLEINVSDVRGKDALYWGIKWIDLTYGNYLRQEKYRDAFHIHNTGRPYPKTGKPFTHDPNYVSNGIKYMKVFSND